MAAGVDPIVSITGRWISLRPISKDDVPTFFRWRADMLNHHLWSSQKRIPTLEEFAAEADHLFRQSTTFLVMSNRDDAPAGFVQAYNMNPAEGWGFFVTYVTPQYRRGYGVEASIALLDYLFRSYPLRKVYADVYEFNQQSISPLLSGGFVEEGRFRQHIWFRDRYWDVIRLAMYRDGWYKFRERTHFLLGVAEETAELMEEQAEREAAGFIPQDPTGAAIDGDGHST
jgi:RimJ/RimL family protein N-acetyltransferase